jgi:hypothetical protein
MYGYDLIYSFKGMVRRFEINRFVEDRQKRNLFEPCLYIPKDLQYLIRLPV